MLKKQPAASWGGGPRLGMMALGLTLLCAAPAPAQIGGVTEVLEVQNIQNEMAGGGNSGDKPKPADDKASEQASTNAGEGAKGAVKPKAGGGQLDQWDDKHSIFRQRSISISIWKFGLVLGIFFSWVRSCDWVNRDSQIYGLGSETWNPAMVAPFVVGFLALPLIPNGLISLVVLLLAWAVPFFAYVAHHNGSVEEHQTVFTGSWFRHQSAEVGRLFGMKIQAEKQAGYLRGPQVDLQARGGDERTDQANLLTARQSPGYVHVKELITEMVSRGSNRVLMDYTADAVTMRYMIDGVWHAGEPRDRDSGDVMLAVMKQLGNLNVSERKRKQEGEFGAVYQKAKYDCQVASQGVRSGERVIVSMRGGKLRGDFQTLTELGMRDKLREQWLEVMNSDSGVIVYSAMPEGGLTTLTDVGLLETDRLLRDFVAIEDSQDPQTDIENIPPHYFDSTQGQSPSEFIPSLSRKYPAVWVVRDLVDTATSKLMMGEVELDRLVVTTAHAKEAPEACLRLLQKKIPHKEFAANVRGVLCTRLIRTLCPDCKVEYEATPTLLKKLGIPPGKVTKFFQPPKPEEVNKPCPTCLGIGFKGRTGLFELLVADDAFRTTLLREPKIEALRKAARSAGMRSFQEEGVLLVAKGLTSLSELSRVLKG